MDWQALADKYYAQCFVRPPMTLVRGEGTRVWDTTGREYLDFVAGIAVCCLGHSNSDIADAVADQARQLVTVSNLYYSVPQIELAGLLLDESPFDRVFFTNSGAESTETAVKAARKYGKNERDGAFEVITAARGFHGRTLAMTAATGTTAYQVPFAPMPAGFKQVEFNDLAAMEAAVSDSTCAIMVEPIQAEGGVWPAADGYLAGLREICDRHGLMLIFDEVQTGIGRLGHVYGFEHWAVEPDMICLAKGLGGGFPLGAVLFKEHAQTLRPGDHGNTFGGSPAMCAAGRVVMQAIRYTGLLEHVRERGDQIVAGLNQLRSTGKVVDIRGVGLLQGFELESPELADHVVADSRANGLILVKVAAAAIRMVPPLTVTDDEVDSALEIIAGSVGA